MEEEVEQRLREDEKLLRRAEKALTEIKVAQGLSEAHAGVLAALRIRLKASRRIAAKTRKTTTPMAPTKMAGQKPLS